MTADQIRCLQPELAALSAFFRPCFKRSASFGHWERYIVGLITDLKRKSIERIALATGVAVRTLRDFLRISRGITSGPTRSCVSWSWTFTVRKKRSA